MFRRLHETGETLTVLIDGRALRVKRGDTAAAALLLAGKASFRRSAVSGENRGPYCGMGVCFECLVTINGIPNRQACLIPVEDGMQIDTGHAAPLLNAKGRP
jgi:predicted molibdopterin-dependent oxidoreductase YjgC